MKQTTTNRRTFRYFMIYLEMFFRVKIHFSTVQLIALKILHTLKTKKLSIRFQNREECESTFYENLEYSLDCCFCIACIFSAFAKTLLQIFRKFLLCYICLRQPCPTEMRHRAKIYFAILERIANIVH